MGVGFVRKTEGPTNCRLAPTDGFVSAGYNSAMNTADDGTTDNNRQPDESDIGPEPDWLIDDEPGSHAPEPDLPPVEEDVDLDAVEPEPDLPPADDGAERAPAQQMASARVPVAEQDQPTVEYVPVEEPRVLQSEVAEQQQPRSRMRPWMWAALPFVLLIATGIIGWFGGTQSLNNVTTWEALRTRQSPLFPAEWTMQIWWAVLALLGVFLIYGLLPAGRAITRIRITGPLVSIALVATSLWVFAQHWNWDIVGLVSILVGLAAITAAYFLVTLGPGITNIRQRIFAVIPLSAALAFGVMLTILTWQNYSSQPFGERGSSILFVFLLIVVTAVFSFFLRDGLFGLVLAIWFAGVVQQQWGHDTAMSLIAVVATLFCAALAVMGTILATESHRPSLTTSVASGRGRTSFFRRSKDSTPGELS